MRTLDNSFAENRKVMTDTKTDIKNITTAPEVVSIAATKYNRLLIIITTVSIVLSLCVAGGGVYLYKNSLSISVANKNKTQTLSSQLTSQITLQDTLSQKSELKNNEFKTEIDHLNQQLLDLQHKNKLYKSDVQALQRSITETNVRHPNDWILSEVEYLVHLSGRKLWLEHDLTTTVALLAAADQRVTEMRDPSLNPLRRALFEDINTLEALPEHNVDSTILALSSLDRRIDKLVISSLEVPDVEENPDTALTSDIGDWKENLHKSWNAFIESFIVISHRDKPVEALLSPKQVWYLRENLRNHLSKAEFAVYREQQDIYDLALTNTLQLVELYYDMTDKGTQKFHDSIENLSKKKVSFDYPDQLKSAPLLTRIIEQRLTKSLAIEDVE